MKLTRIELLQEINSIKISNYIAELIEKNRNNDITYQDFFEDNFDDICFFSKQTALNSYDEIDKKIISEENPECIEIGKEIWIRDYQSHIEDEVECSVRAYLETQAITVMHEVLNKLTTCFK